jgi:leucyl aminopeptidase
MQIDVLAKLAAAAGVSVVFVSEGRKLLGLGAALGPVLQRALKAPAFTGKRGETMDVAGSAAGRVLLVGVGDPKAMSAIRARKLGGKIAAHLLRLREPKAQILGGTDFGKVDEAVFLGNIALGARLRAYRFGKYISAAKKGEEPAEIASLGLVTAERSAVQTLVAEADALATGVNFARDLVNEPPSSLWPDVFAKRMQALKKHGVKVEVHDEVALRKMGAGGILAVAQGSQHPPRLVVLRWNGKGGKQKGGPIALVGKGVCFDSGGLSLKRTSQMLTMKGDMGGAAAVTGAILAAALRKAKVDVVGVMALVENMPSGTSYKPGDIVKTLAGKTLEIFDTDAEGRVTLVDSLHYAAKLKPCCILDAATLTYSVTAAVGPIYAGLFANDDSLAAEVLAAGEAAGEQLWRLPVNADYVKNLSSRIADYKQVAADDLGADAPHAAALMGEFVNNVPWAHLDIANKEFATKDNAICPEGASGYAVALFDAFLRQRE